MNAFFIENLLVATSVLCKDFVDISCKNSHNTRRLYVAAAHLFLKWNFILVCRMFFLIDGTLKLTDLQCHRIYSCFY